MTLEQYNMLITLLNFKSDMQDKETNKHATSIVTVQGKDGHDYGDD